MSGSLDLRDNTTCWLASSSASLPLSIHSVNLTSLAHQTPLQVRCQNQSTQHKESFLCILTKFSYLKGFFSNPKLLGSRHRPGHTADALRLGTGVVFNETESQSIHTLTQ